MPMLVVNGKEVEFGEDGFLTNRDDWNEDVMRTIAAREHIELTGDIEKYVRSAREIYEKERVVPPLREFSKRHGGDRKGSHLNELFHGGPMKKIAMLGGLPKPTGCV